MDTQSSESKRKSSVEPFRMGDETISSRPFCSVCVFACSTWER